MLPNWLYGKSKSKLATILGGGGGTPADYNQVKAQINSMVNMLGAKNLLPLTKRTGGTQSGVTFTVNDNGSITVNGTATSAIGQNEGINKIFYGVIPKGEYLISCKKDKTTFVKAYYALNGSSTAISVEQDSVLSLDNDSTLDMWIYVANTAVLDNVTFYPMLRLASITDGTYEPYAMTNQELTEKLTSDTNLGTAIDLSTYTAYSNMFTAPSDGYVHFQSDASGSQMRTIYTYGNNTTDAADSHFTHSTSENNKAFEIYVRKGLKIYVDGLQSGDTINFYPLL
jgi:hypothetical protein